VFRYEEKLKIVGVGRGRGGGGGGGCSNTAFFFKIGFFFLCFLGCSNSAVVLIMRCSFVSILRCALIIRCGQGGGQIIVGVDFHNLNKGQRRGKKRVQPLRTKRRR
jgi:hypothetical protein